MRTTVTLDADTEQIVRRRMRERNMSFKEALNEAIRDGASGEAGAERFETPTAAMGESRVDLDRALSVAGQLEDGELARRLRTGS